MTVCPQCFDAGWVLDAKLDKEPTTLELIPCIYPPCTKSRRPVAVLCVDMLRATPTMHPSEGYVMSLVPQRTREWYRA